MMPGAGSLGETPVVADAMRGLFFGASLWLDPERSTRAGRGHDPERGEEVGRAR